MKGKGYIINQNTEIYCYGAAAIGKIVLKNNKQMNIMGFIDARADEIVTMCGKSVYSWNNIQEIDNEAVIIVTVKNVFEHEEIAYQLFEKGYKKIIYKPMAVLEGKGTKKECEISNVWDRIIQGNEEYPLDSIPFYENNFNYEFLDYAKISDKKDEVIAYVPVELIYTNNTTEFWGDINIQALYPHIKFFRFLENKCDGEVEDYLEFCENSAKRLGDIVISDSWKKNVIRNRTMIYEQMCKSRDIDPDFFVRSAPTAEWNVKGYFNLTSGKHRASYLVASGYRYLALKVSQEDYNYWLMDETVQKLKNNILEMNIRKLSYKVLHPYFYKFPNSEEMYYEVFEGDIITKLCKMSYEEQRAITVVTNLKADNSFLELLRKSKFLNVLQQDCISDKIVDVCIINEMQGDKCNIEGKKGFYITDNDNQRKVVRQYYDKGKKVFLIER